MDDAGRPAVVVREEQKTKKKSKIGMKDAGGWESVNQQDESRDGR